MAQASNKIFWGFLLVLVNFYVFGINIFPNTVGYFIAAAGLGKLSSQSSYFTKAKIGTIVLAILSLPNIIKIDNWLKEAPSFWALGYSTVIQLLHLVVVLIILQGIMEGASRNANPLLHNNEKNLSRVYFIGKFITMFFTPFVQNVPKDLGLTIVIGSALISIVMEIMFLVLLRRFRHSHIPKYSTYLEI